MRKITWSIRPLRLIFLLFLGAVLFDNYGGGALFLYALSQVDVKLP